LSLEGADLSIYRVGPELGRGGMGSVYRAVSTADGAGLSAGSEVALKVFHPELVANERAFAFFRHEAEIGKEILHENLVRTYGIANAEWEGRSYHFLVMELVEGRTLKDLLSELGVLPENLLYLVADQALGALQVIHERGVVHRDIKPENIVITPDHRVLLMDFGLARREAGRDLVQSGSFVGSLTYAPPEQFKETGVGPRADIYAFGVSLFELTTGVNPFQADSVGEILKKKLHEELEPPRSVNPDIDSFLNQVIFTCTEREPADRFSSAGELRKILRDGERSDWWQLESAGRAALSAEPALKRVRVARPTPLIGRADARKALGDVRERANREGAVLLLSGGTGVGKSRLVYEFLEEAVGAGGPALAVGRGEGAGGRGYGPFVDALGDLLMPPGSSFAVLHARLGEILARTPGVVDTMAQFVLGALQPGPESGLSRDALFAAVGDVLRAVAAERSLLLVIEDLHRTGSESVELFEHVARCLSGHGALVVGVVSSDEIEDGSPIADVVERCRRDDEVTVLELDNLSATETDEIVRFVVGHERTVRTVGPKLWARSEGNPLIVVEFLEHLRQNGRLVEEDGGLLLVGDPEDIVIPESLRDLVSMKLAVLDDEQRETLNMAAVLGGRFEATLLAELLDENDVWLLQILAALERKHRLLQSSGRGSFRFASHQLEHTVYESIPPESRIERHSAVADNLRAKGEPSGEIAYSLLRHLFHAGRVIEATAFLESALEHMAANLPAGPVAPILEKIAEAFEPAVPEKRFAIAMKQWAVYDLLASREDQMRVLDVARQVAEEMGEPGPRARVHALRAGTFWYAGDFDRARKEAEKGLALARQAGERKWESTCLHTLGVVDFRRGEIEPCVERWREALRIRREIGDRRGVASTLQALALVMPAVGEDEKVLPTMQEALEIWREIGERRGEASILMNIGNRLVDMAQYKEGLEHLELAIGRHRETGALISEALALTNLGRAQHILGSIDDARVSWERALQLFSDLGNPSGELSARAMLGSALGAYGEYDAAREHLRAAIELAEQIGSKDRLVEAHRELADLCHATGSPRVAWEHLDTALAIEGELGSARSRVTTLGVAGKLALADEDWERAVEFLARAAPDARNGDGLSAPLILCRLARALEGAGRTGEAEECARETLERLEATAKVSTLSGPEVYYTLCGFQGDRAAHEDLLSLARAIVEERAQRIRNDTWREHFLERTWPNSEILDSETPGDGRVPPPG